MLVCLCQAQNELSISLRVWLFSLSKPQQVCRNLSTFFQLTPVDSISMWLEFLSWWELNHTHKHHHIEITQLRCGCSCSHDAFTKVLRKVPSALLLFTDMWYWLTSVALLIWGLFALLTLTFPHCCAAEVQIHKSPCSPQGPFMRSRAAIIWYHPAGCLLYRSGEK